MRRAAAIEPERVVIADGVDDERVALPTPDGMPVPRREHIIRMLAAVHVDDAMRSAVAELVKDVDLRHDFRSEAVDHLPPERVDTGHAHRRTRDVRLVLLFALVPEFLRPWQQRKLPRFQPTFALDVG